MKKKFERQLKKFVETFQKHISSSDGQWTVKGFIDIFENVYTISGDTKVLSKILEIHLFPKILEFANKYGYKVVLADHQNYYPDISFVKEDNEKLKFAVDFKTTYRNKKNHTCVMGLLWVLMVLIFKIGILRKISSFLTINMQVIFV